MTSALSLGSTVRLSTGYEMPLLGLGVFRSEDCVGACEAALKAGYRHIDSARTYGNEDQVGKAVRRSGVMRQEIFITTKITSWYHGHERAKQAVDDSLNDFDFEYVDLYLIHDPLSGKDKRLQTYKALLEAQKAGKIRSVGVSNYNINHMEEIREAGLPPPSVNQVELHPWCQQRTITDYCAKHNIIVQAYTPLTRSRYLEHPLLVDIATAHEKDPAQVLIRWSLQKGFVPLPKSATPSRVASNTQVYDFELTADEMAQLDVCDQGDAGSVTWNPIHGA